jgi:hypothetical protein
LIFEIRLLEINFIAFVKIKIIKMEASINEVNDFKEEICLIFALKEKIGALADALKIFEVNSYF